MKPETIALASTGAAGTSRALIERACAILMPASPGIRDFGASRTFSVAVRPHKDRETENMSVSDLFALID